MSGDGVFAWLAGHLAEADDDRAFTMAHVLELPDDERTVMRHVMRDSGWTTITLLTAQLGAIVPDLDRVVASLVDRGALEIEGETVMVGAITPHRRRTPGGLWERLSDL